MTQEKLTTTIYLVLIHLRGKQDQLENEHVVEHPQQAFPFGPSMHGPRFIHDLYCHCLRVLRNTFTTRDVADEWAEGYMIHHPYDFAFSLEIETPKPKESDQSAT